MPLWGSLPRTRADESSNDEAPSGSTGKLRSPLGVNRWRVLAVMSLSVFMVFVDGSVVKPAAASRRLCALKPIPTTSIWCGARSVRRRCTSTRYS
jgi:hypothetical protein